MRTIILCALLGFIVPPALASEPGGHTARLARVPDTAAARKSADLIARVERAIGAHVATCQISNLWILPTGDANSVFMTYDAPAGPQLALVEMRGDRIAKLVSYSDAPPASGACQLATRRN